jgi:hypothetical protein
VRDGAIPGRFREAPRRFFLVVPRARGEDPDIVELLDDMLAIHG